MEQYTVDWRLMEAVMHASYQGSAVTLERARALTTLDKFSRPERRPYPAWAVESPGDFSLIGEMGELHTLKFSGFLVDGPGDLLQVKDFSFLRRCVKLRALDVASTTFSDCALLLDLPALRSVYLPPKSQLTHLETLERLSPEVEVKFFDLWPVPVAAKAVADGGGEPAQKPAVLPGQIAIDSRLLGAVKQSLGRLPSVPYDLEQVRTLDNFFNSVNPYYTSVSERFAVVNGDFSAIGRMTKLRRLIVSRATTNRVLNMGDFSWLANCRQLQHLDLSWSNFTDCALLLQLPALKTVQLPMAGLLTHLDALEQLPEKVKVSFSELVDMDPLLMKAILSACYQLNPTMEQVKAITTLDNFAPASDHPGPRWIRWRSGDFSFLSQLQNLHTLLFTGFRESPLPSRLMIDDFSFLKQLPNLKRLDLRYTNFSDCAQLPDLKQMSFCRLPPKERLTNLDCLPKTTKITFLEPAANVPAPYVPGSSVPEGSEEVKAIIAELNRRTGKPCVTLTLDPSGPMGLRDSKIGGLPYWPAGMDYPTGPRGNKLTLLAQIDLAQVGAMDPLPTCGLLQFFLDGEDDVFGVEFDGPTTQTAFRVVYHPDPDPSVTVEDVEALDLPTHENSEMFPVFKAAALVGKMGQSCINVNSDAFEDLFASIVEERTGQRPQGDAEEYLSQGDWDYLFHQLYNEGSRMLGYPYFTQYDPRDEDDPHDTLLFQLDTEYVENEDYVMWGDSGVANFFIPLDKLKARDFSDIWYNWDCC